MYGTVQDASGAVIPSAAIVLRNVETGRNYQTKTDEAGNFTVTLVPIGNYEVSAEAPGFKKATVTGVTLRVNDNRRMVLTLDVGQVTEAVTVQAEAVVVNTSSGTTSNVIEGHEMVQLPSRGRYVLPFALLMPGAISTTPYDRRSNNTSVNGVRPTHNAWLLDGGYNIDTGGNWGSPLAPNIEDVAEFRAIRGNYSAEFGIGGGSQFNVITKSGTNDLHGSAYEFLRNTELNARNYFSPSREPFKGNDFGFTVGGPVYLPKLYDGRNKTFFFVHLGWIKERREARFFQKLPEIPFRSGDFSTLGKTITDPLSGQPFPGNVIPSSRFDKNAPGYVKMYPALNYRDAAGRNWTAGQGRLDDTGERTFRGDHNFSEKHRIMARYTQELRFSDFRVDPGFDWLRRQDKTPARNLVVNFNSSFRPNLINDFNLVRSHNRIMQFPPDVSGATWGISIPKLFVTNEQTYPLTSLNLSRIPDKVPNISLVNYSSIAPSAPWSNFQTIYDIKDNLIWIKGAHTLKMGFDYAYEIKFEPTNTNVFGDFNFDGRVTGDAFADLLLGRAAEYNETDTVAFNDNRRNAFEAYMDDSWKVTRRLTLNFGLRYSFFPPAHEASDKYRVFRIANYDPSKAVTLNTSGQIIKNSGDLLNGNVNPVSYWRNSHRNLAPRFSFAYDLFGDGKTALRGGYGMFYSREILGAFILMSGNPPFAKLVSLFNTGLSNPGGGTARDVDLPITLGNIDTNQLTPYTQQWNLNIQRALSGSTMLEIGYSGSRAIHMMRTQDINQPLANAGIANGTLNANFLRPYKGWGVINQREQSYMSNYHGLQTGLSRNFSRGLG
ncbi:MAG: TonB-dependent receptor, partial [Acidobacteria bacterium]|nr:TonB-dependent receptor [Acidobacteriota bacterium]